MEDLEDTKQLDITLKSQNEKHIIGTEKYKEDLEDIKQLDITQKVTEEDITRTKEGGTGWLQRKE